MSDKINEAVKKAAEKVVKAGAAAIVGVAVVKLGIPQELAQSIVDPIAAGVIASSTYAAMLGGELIKLNLRKWISKIW